MFLQKFDKIKVLKILSLISFCTIASALLLSKFRGECVSSLFLDKVTLAIESDVYRIPSCQSSRSRPYISNYNRQQDFIKIKSILDQVEELYLLIGKASFIRTRLELSFIEKESDYFEVSGHKLTFNLGVIDQPGRLQVALLYKLIYDADVFGAELSSFEKSLLAEVLSTSIWSAFGLKTGSQNFMPQHHSLSSMCDTKFKSLNLANQCAQGRLLSWDHVQKIAVQGYLLDKWSKAFAQIRPYYRFQLLKNILSKTKAFEHVEHLSLPLSIEPMLTQQEVNWIKQVNKTLLGRMDSALAKEIKASLSYDFFPTFVYLKLKSPLLDLNDSSFVQPNWLIGSNDDHKLNQVWSSMGRVRDSLLQQANQAVLIKCSPPSVRELMSLPASVEKVYIVKECNELALDHLLDIQKKGIESFLAKNPKISYFLAHLPSLRWLGEKLTLNPFILIELEQFDHPIFKVLGWQDKWFDQDSQSIKVIASVEAIQKYRINTKENLDF